jgi:hypothetical protein
MFFVWYLCRGVILIEDNLIKCNWHGCTKNVFHHNDEGIKHLLLKCTFVRLYRQSSKLVLPYTPCNVANIFGNWQNERCMQATLRASRRHTAVETI